MTSRLEPPQSIGARPPEPEASDAIEACTLFIVGPDCSGLVASISAELRERSPWHAERGATIVWQAAPDAGESFASAPLGMEFRVLLEDAELEPGKAYFVPPQRRAWFEGTRLCVAPRSPSERHPIDRLLLSLAEGWGNRITCVLALPLEDDGECGLRIIRAVGGIAVQRSAAAERAPRRGDSAPGHSAKRGRRSGKAQHFGEPLVAAEPGGPSPHVAPRSGAVLSPRLDVLARLGEACRRAAERAKRGGRVRVWMPCCGTGGLAYLLAMQLSEVAAASAPTPSLLVFGTDRDESSLAVARAGRYPTRAALGMDPDLRGRYTFDEGETIRVAESLREICIFSRHELLRDPPMAHMDLLVCQGVFDRVPPENHLALIAALHFSLRDGGLMLALDHAEHYPEDRFERLEGGLLRARQPALELRSRAAAGKPPLPPLLLPASATGPVHPVEAAPLEAALYDVAVPLVVCDSALRVSFLSRESQVVFRLSAEDLGSELAALSSRLPGGGELVSRAEHVVATSEPQELSIRVRRRTYLARVSATRSTSQPGVCIAFSDVTQLERARSRAVAQQHQHAAIARFSEVALGLVPPSALYEAALAALFGSVNACSAGIIVAPMGHGRELEVLASRGLGAEPLRTLRGVGDSGELLYDALQSACVVSQSGERATLRDPDQPAAPEQPRSARARQGLTTLQGGVACPIAAEGEVFGVVALYGRPPGIDNLDSQHFIQALANVLGGAVARQRTRRRIALELEVSRALAGAVDVTSLGEGLRLALAEALSANALEIWAARAESNGELWRIYPLAASVLAERLWPEDVGRSGDAEPVFSPLEAGGGELFVPVVGVTGLPHLLRLEGRTLRAPDRDLMGGLRRIGHLLADSLERLRMLERSLQSEASYRQKSAELEALYASLPVGVSIHDRRGAIRHYNRHLVALGAPPAESRAEPLARLYADKVPACIARVLERGEPLQDVELSIAEGGTTCSWLCNFAPIRDAEGNPHGASAVVQDISALKSVELRLRETDRQKDDFLAMLGHELRNPLAAIRNATELLGRIEASSAQLSRLHGVLERQTQQTIKLVDGLLDVARVARGKVELQRRPVQLVELVRQVVEDRRSQFGGRRLDLRLPGEELWAEVDRARMVQILDNLLSNSLKFTATDGKICIEMARLEGRGVLSVQDDGIGMDAALLPRIFEPFRQGRGVQSQSQGLGLGLALVKGLVDLHGFELAAHSAGAGRGARFEIAFPLIDAAPEEPPASRIDARRLDLLLVEDNLDIAETLAELLASAGHHVEHQASAEGALAHLRRRRPEVVLCDIGLPGMDGLELAALLRADPEFRDLKLVAMTGFGDASTRGRIERAGFDRHLIKPVQLDALSDCLARVAAPWELSRR